MKETRFDGTEILSTGGKDEFGRMWSDPNNISVSLHKPGSIVKLSDAEYEVQHDGSWKRIK